MTMVHTALTVKQRTHVTKKMYGNIFFVNTITALRGLSIIPIVILMHNEWYFVAFCTALVAVQLDWLDGFLARRMNAVTQFGAFADPLSDKFFFVVALLALHHCVHLVVLISAIALEIFLISHRIVVLARHNTADVSASAFGKTKAVLQNIVVCAFLFGLYLEAIHQGWSAFFVVWCAPILLYVSVAFAMLSAVGHIRRHSNA